MNYLTVDAMISGTGIRDSLNGGYLEPSELGLDKNVTMSIKVWLAEYRELNIQGFTNTIRLKQLDEVGHELAKKISHAIPEAKVTYYSDWKQQRMR